MYSNRRIPVIAAIVVAFCVCANAQSASKLSAPVLGYSINPDLTAIRSIMGVPGAAMFGDPINTAVPFTSGVVSPDSTFCLAANADNGLPIRISLPAGSVTPIANARQGPARIIISPGSSSAALVYSDSIAVVQGLPDAPSVARELSDLEDIGPVAVSDDGELLLARTGSTVRLFRGEVWSDLALTSKLQAAAFLQQSEDAALDTSEGIVLIRNLGAPTSTQRIARLASDVVAIVFLTSERLLTASADGSIVTYDLAAATASTCTCNCSPNGLYRLGAKGVFQLLNRAENGTFLVDTTSLTRTVFVPRTQQ